MSAASTQSTYQLPMGYDEDRVVLLARDPHCLYAYWEISNSRKDAFINEFGHELWKKSIPVLKVTNMSKNNVFNVKVNDHSRSWYIQVEDSNCMYTAELGRMVSDRFFISLANSNYAATPGNSISAVKTAYFINYKDLKNGRLDLESRKIYETHTFDFSNTDIIGLSSPELYGKNVHQSTLGISSAELMGISFEEHLGISSGSFYG